LSRDFDVIVDHLAESIAETIKKKNKDYGNSFEKMIDKYGMVALLIRFQDKFGRLDSIVLKGQAVEVKDESIEDTLLDIAGYAILELARRKKIKTEEVAEKLLSPCEDNRPLASNVINDGWSYHA
jgi:hypothetical protein